MEPQNSTNRRSSIDNESQRVIDVEDAELEQEMFNENDADNGEKSSEPKKRRQYSNAWKHFTVITKRNKLGKLEERAQCNHCKNDYAYDPHKNGTNSYNRHMKTCKLLQRNGDVSQMLIDAEARLQARRIDQSVFKEMVAKSIIQHDLPFSYVEYERVREVWKYLNPDVKFFCRNTAASEVYKFYENEIVKLKHELAHLPGRISFTTDLWTAITHEGYMCLTAHYVDKNWKLNNKIISFYAFEPPHTGFRIAMEILAKWTEWGVDKKVFSITVDNARNNDSMQDIIKSQLLIQDDLLCRGDFFHVRCVAHILNIIVQKGLEMIGDSLHKIRESIKYVQASQQREILFARCVKNVGLDLNGGLILDVKTRWNSTYKMLDRAVKYSAAFGNLKVLDAKHYQCHLTDDEWHRLKQMSDFLEPFDVITNLISGSTYPTSNLYFFQVWKIHNWLTMNERNTDEIIRTMVGPMKEMFDKYWGEVGDIFAMATVFDPRLKLSLTDYCFAQLDTSSCTRRKEHLRAQLRRLFEVYEKKSQTTSSSTMASVTVQEKKEGQTGNLGNYSDFLAFRKTNVVVNGKTSLDMYLDDPILEMSEFESLDILKYWKDNSPRYGELASMACDLLSIPITTVASESSFSIGSRVLNKYRSCLLPKNVQALICSRNWLKGFEAYENEEDKEPNAKAEILPSQQSTVEDED